MTSPDASIQFRYTGKTTDISFPTQSKIPIHELMGMAVNALTSIKL